jgi:hypothetical protein
MGVGVRRLLAAVVAAALAVFVVIPDLPARAAGPVGFRHVFSDGDAFNLASYTIPDPYAFTSGSYALLVTSSAVARGTPNVPTVTGKNLNWELVASQVLAGSRLSVFQTWVDNPNNAGQITFNFGGQVQLRNGRSFFESTTPLDRSDPIVQMVFSSGSGTSAQVTLASFADPVGNATVLGVTKNLREPFTNEMTELGDTNAGPPGDINGTTGEQYRLSTAWRSGQELTPSASWTQATTWQAVAIEVTAESD